MILTAPQFYSQERLDLEDVNALLESAKTDEQLYTKEFFSAINYILKGFNVSGIGSTSGTIAMADATLIIGAGTGDFSYFIAPPSPPNITITAASLIASARNYIELDLSYVLDTPSDKAFWDPTTNGGLGAEFSQEVNTMQDVNVNYVVLTGGFSGLPDRLPLAIMDVNGSGIITVILDRRQLFFREGLPTNIFASFAWASNIEPAYAVVLSGETGTFILGETVTFSGSGVTATVTTGGTTNIAVNIPSNITFTAGETCTGGTSGATGTVVSIWESFSGADKDIKCIKDEFMALQTEIRRLKGTPFWYSIATASATGLANFINSAIVGSTTASAPSFAWDGSNLSITDSNGSPSSADILAKIIQLGTTQSFNLLRADGSASTSVIPIASGQVLFVQLPTSGSQSYSGNGTGASNYQVVAQNAFVQSDQNYWIAIRIGTELYIRGQGEITAGQSIQIGQASSGSGVIKATLYDNTSTTLPTGTSYTNDGVTIANGQTVLFSNLVSGNNEIYKVSGVGTALAWAAQSSFTNEGTTPSTGDSVLILQGTNFALQAGIWNGTIWSFRNTIRLFNGSNYWELGSQQVFTIADNTTGTVFTLPAVGYENIHVHYSISRNGAKETGILYMTNNHTIAALGQEGGYLGADVGVTFTPVISGGNILLNFATTSLGFSGTLKYHIERWAD